MLECIFPYRMTAMLKQHVGYLWSRTKNGSLCRIWNW